MVLSKSEVKSVGAFKCHVENMGVSKSNMAGDVFHESFEKDESFSKPKPKVKWRTSWELEVAAVLPSV